MFCFLGNDFSVKDCLGEEILHCLSQIKMPWLESRGKVKCHYVLCQKEKILRDCFLYFIKICFWWVELVFSSELFIIQQVTTAIHQVNHRPNTENNIDANFHYRGQSEYISIDLALEILKSKFSIIANKSIPCPHFITIDIFSL